MSGPLGLLKKITTDLESRFRLELAKSGRTVKHFELEQNVSSVWSDNTLQDLYSEKQLDGAVVSLTLLEMFSRIHYQLDNLLRSVPDKYDINDESLLHNRVKRSMDSHQNVSEGFSFEEDPSLMECLHKNSSERVKREILGGIALGVGMWNSYRISTIESHFANLSSKFNVLVDSVSLLSSQHTQLAADVELMKRLIHMISSNNYRKILAMSVSTSNRLQSVVDDVSDIVTMGRQRKVSSRLINGDSLMELFVKLKKKAVELESRLLLEHHTDIYDVQASYGYSQDGLFFKIYVHVPLASNSETLSLFEHIPFPMAYQSMIANATVTPDPGPDKFLAVMPTEISPDGHKFRVLNEVELQGCFKLRNYFLCSGRNTLRLDFKSSCIGSLWMQDHNLVIKNCAMKLEPLHEVVVKTAPRQWLVFSPKLLFISTKCGKNTVESLRFERQTLVTLVENCEITLTRFLLSTDTNSMLDFKVRTFEWRYFGSIFSPTSTADDDLNKIIDKISFSKSKYGLPDLSDLRHYFDVSENRLSRIWEAITNLNLFSWFGNVYMFILYVVIIWLCIMALTKGWFKKCCCPKKNIIPRRNSSIIRSVRSSSVAYNVPVQQQSSTPENNMPPSYSSIVSAPSESFNSNSDPNLMYPLVPMVSEVNQRSGAMYPLVPLESSEADQCLIKFGSGNHENFICHHHDPIHGCNGSFTK